MYAAIGYPILELTNYHISILLEYLASPMSDSTLNHSTLYFIDFPIVYVVGTKLFELTFVDNLIKLSLQRLFNHHICTFQL